jgi:hypothetical protein
MAKNFNCQKKSRKIIGSHKIKRTVIARLRMIMGRYRVKREWNETLTGTGTGTERKLMGRWRDVDG